MNKPMNQPHLSGPAAGPGRSDLPRSNRRFFAALLVVALLIAGGVSYYASSQPDGLEYVAGSTGFEATAKEHATGSGPLADYGVKGVANDRLSGGLAGVIGVGLTLLIAGSVTWLVRRRTPAAGVPADTGSVVSAAAPERA